MKFSRNFLAQAGVEKLMAVGVSGEQVCTGSGATGDGSRFFSGPGSISRSCGMSGKSYNLNPHGPSVGGGEFCPGVLSASMKAF